MITKPGTIICDIDGCLIRHRSTLSGVLDEKPELLPGAQEKFCEWERLGHHIVLLTGRPESMRQHTEVELTALGLFWDTLVMGVGGGPRVLINDEKPDGQVTAFGLCIPRDIGLENVELPF